MTGDVSAHMVNFRDIHGGVHRHHHAASRQPVSLPYRTGSMPKPADSYQQRPAVQQVAAALGHGRAVVLSSETTTKTGVLSGLGGVGKSQIAVGVAEQAWASGEVEVLAWVTAASREAILTAYARLAADLTGIEDPTPEQGSERLLTWLASSTIGWLLILDDVQDPGDLNGLWPPITSSGQTVVTTRRRDAVLRGHGRQRIDVSEFTNGEALAYLRTRLADQAHLLDGADELATALGCLPLALAQATASMLDRGWTCSDYLARFTDRRRTLDSLWPEGEPLPDEHRSTVAATWSLSIEQANQLHPAGVARPLLQLASVLDPNGIPTDLFTAPASLHWLTKALGREVTAEDAAEGLACLHRLSLLTLDNRSTLRVARVHAMVQRATQDNLSEAQAATAVSLAADALVQVWPSIERDTTVGQTLRANTAALRDAGEKHLWYPCGHTVLFRAALSLCETGLVNETVDYHQCLYATATY
ncbi:NB-ARC domain-containing protein [Kutzneria albida]|uniref:NB-ARC domain-containing protein n=1 Tax=Kutzneria albida TaxID=43357 RepID=UPI0006941309|nr:NB-ARC domain-containing protein [Kutzneria albida]